MEPQFPCDLGDRRLLTEKELDKLTNFEGKLLERAARRCSKGLGDFGHGMK